MAGVGEKFCPFPWTRVEITEPFLGLRRFGGMALHAIDLRVGGRGARSPKILIRVGIDPLSMRMGSAVFLAASDTDVVPGTLSLLKPLHAVGIHRFSPNGA